MIWGICSSLGVTISTIVDATLVGNIIGSNGLAVANVATPMFLLYGLIGITLGGGAGVLIGNALGAADEEKANQFFSSVLTTGIIIGVIFAIFAAIFRNGMCTFLGATPELLGQALNYLTVVFCSAPIFVVYNILSIIVRTDSDPKLAAAASVGVIITNLSLDLLFMLVFRWGVTGASASLCIAEGVGLVILLFHFRRKQAILKLQLSKPKISEIKNFTTNGFGVGSACIFQAVVMLVFNNLLLKDNTSIGVYSVAVFGVMYTMSTIPSAVFDGAGAAASTVVSVLGGEKDKNGMLAVITDGMRIVMASGLVLALIFLLAAGPILTFFGIERDASFDMAVVSFRIYSVSLLLSGVNVLITAFWQSIGRIKLASIMSVLRNCLLMIILGIIFIPWLGLKGLALSYVVSEALCLGIVLVVRRVNDSQGYVERNYSFDKQVFERYYPIEEGSMESLTAELEKVCDEWEIDYKKSFFISLIAEELILNIMKYGLKSNDKKRYVSVKLMNDDGQYVLRIRDNVNIYNPFDLHGDDVDQAAMKLIKEKAKDYSYQRKLVFNYLYIVL